MVSIILPTYNRASLLPRAIRSVLAQSVRDWELVIVADHCSDDTIRAVSQFDDPRLRFIKLSENVGGAQARNIGIDHANGEYIAFIDDDDEWLPNKLERQIELFSHNNDICLATTNYIRVSETTRKAVAVPRVISLQDLYYHNVCGSFSFCMTKKALIQGIRLDSRLKACQDWDFWISLLKNSGMKCYATEESLVLYHVHGSERLSTSLVNHYHSFLRFLRKHNAAMSEDHRAYNYALLNLENCCLGNKSIVEKWLLTCRTLCYARKTKKFNLLQCLKLFLYPFWQQYINRV